jgi:hypothetical protein
MPTTAVAVLQAARARYSADEAARRQAEEAARRQIPELPDMLRDDIMDLRSEAMWADTVRTRPDIFLSPRAQSVFEGDVQKLMVRKGFTRVQARQILNNPHGVRVPKPTPRRPAEDLWDRLPPPPLQ